MLAIVSTQHCRRVGADWHTFQPGFMTFHADCAVTLLDAAAASWVYIISQSIRPRRGEGPQTSAPTAAKSTRLLINMLLAVPVNQLGGDHLMTAGGMFK